MKIGFSTLGCPEWNFNKIVSNAHQLGYNGIEIRGITGEFDIYKCAEFSRKNIQSTKRFLADNEIELVCISSSAMFHWPDRQEIRKHIDSAKRFIDLAHEANAPYVRVFPNNKVAGEAEEVTAERISGALAEAGRHAQDAGVKLVLETHGEFLSGKTVKTLVKNASCPAVGILWDTHHPYRFLGESPEETWKDIGDVTWHTHFKDSTGTAGDFTYTFFGLGTVPVKEILQVMNSGGYSGYVCLEWEKIWIPSLKEPEEVFPQFINKMREYLEELNIG